MSEQMDAVTRRVLERLADRPIVDEQVYNEELRYCWVDEDDQRVSPVHKDFGKALSWISNWPGLVARLEHWRSGGSPWTHGEESIAKLERSVSITGKPPVELKRVVTRTIGEPIADYEVAAIEAAMRAAGLRA